jgi:hypothetical protein
LFILFDFYFDGKIGTAEFTEPATDTICRPSRKYLVVIIEFQDIFWAKMDADTAPLAPFRID